MREYEQKVERVEQEKEQTEKRLEAELEKCLQEVKVLIEQKSELENRVVQFSQSY